MQGTELQTVLLLVLLALVVLLLLPAIRSSSRLGVQCVRGIMQQHRAGRLATQQQEAAAHLLLLLPQQWQEQWQALLLVLVLHSSRWAVLMHGSSSRMVRWGMGRCSSSSQTLTAVSLACRSRTGTWGLHSSKCSSRSSSRGCKAAEYEAAARSDLQQQQQQQQQQLEHWRLDVGFYCCALAMTTAQALTEGDSARNFGAKVMKRGGQWLQKTEASRRGMCIYGSTVETLQLTCDPGGLRQGVVWLQSWLQGRTVLAGGATRGWVTVSISASALLPV
jgi:hypothetical protein